MNGYAKSGYEPPRGAGIGCALLLPVLVVGSFLLIDEHAHAGDAYLLAEIVGWWTLCIGAGSGSMFLVAKWRRTDGSVYALIVAIALPLAVLALHSTVAQPGTATWVKDAYIASLKAIGFMVVPAVAGRALLRGHQTG